MEFNSITARRYRVCIDRKFVLTTLISTVLFPIVCLSQPHTIESNISADPCRSISERSARIQCYETPGTSGNQTKAYGAMLASGWGLVRTSNPSGGVNMISISHAADTKKSDPNFAGMVLRCVEDQIEILLVVIEPYRPNVQIDLTIKVDSSLTSTKGNIVPPGIMIHLAPEAAKLIMEGQRAPDELDVTLASESDGITRGFIKLAGVEPAIVTLKKLCAAR